MRFIREGFLFFVSGILILTLGIALTIQSTLGASPFDALLVGLHRTFGLTIGSWEIVVGLTMVLCNALAEKKKPEYLALLTSLITGAGIDFWLFLIRGWIEPSSWIGQYICLTLGILLTGVGVATYLQSKFAPNPLDRSMLVMSKLTGWSVTYSRACISLVLVVLAFFFDGAIGIGTLINALVTGALITYFIPYVKRFRNTLPTIVKGNT
ncbi:YitT family protein [Aquibacillus koreensis]|uniref:YitT family protein n=1 Tax=Aquibacillus koreensis TaxID=279446 RepID=A0A9X3WNC5_9BACI|nr:YitT family protein [Aquibacillus koreensis]MCT2535953.1 YitT family protein [Aquibacillus koreensis]MDC3420409.1 YitT family protein [Aquibacillus koreensis]